jgi:1-phosphofructokinase
MGDLSEVEDNGPEETGPRVTVLAPAPSIVVEIVDRPGSEDPTETEIHMHPGGQGAWVAGMAVALGAEVSVSAPLGGELGEILAQMLRAAGIRVPESGEGAGTGAAVVDLRADEREEIAVMPPPALGRHDLDDLYGLALVDALESDVVIITGVNPAELIPPDFFARLVADVRAGGVPVVADLSGEIALAVIAERPSVLKMSHEEVLAAGMAPNNDVPDLLHAAQDIVAEGVGAVVVSRAEDPALLVTADGAWLVSGPAVSPVITSGAGDSMTAGIAVGLGRGLPVPDAVRLGAAAGALNVARRGLGSGRRDQIERLAEQIEIAPVGDGSLEVA